MKHPSIRELFEHWNERRGVRPAPERADIEPAAIRSVLADTFILAFEPRAGHPFRIAGTRVCALFGRELKGTAFLDLWPTGVRSEINDLLAIVTEESLGVVAGAAGRSTADLVLPLELLVLPLRNRARVGTRVLGALAPGELPRWLGTSALRELTLGTQRYLGAATTGHHLSPARLPVSSRVRIRHGFAVYDGGNPGRAD